MFLSNPYICDLCAKIISDENEMVTIHINRKDFPEEVLEYHHNCAKESLSQLVNQSTLTRKYLVPETML